MKTFKKFETWLPLFMGFYNTYLDGDEDIDNELQELNCDYGDLVIDYKAYQQDVSKWFVDKIAELINDDLGIKCKVKFQELTSPKEYNFYNDSVNVDIKFSVRGLKKLKELINDNNRELNDVIFDDYKGCDGFIPSYSNNIEDWENDTKDWTDFDCNEHYLGKVLEMLLRADDIGIDENIVNDFFDSELKLSNYITNYDELREKQEQE